MARSSSLRSFFSAARAWFALVVLGAVIGGAVSFGIGVATPPTYLGHVTVLVSPAPAPDPITLGDVEVTQALAPTFAELTTTAPLLQRVITATNLDEDTDTLAKAISTHVPVGTSLIEIGVEDHDPKVAAAVANEIAAQLMALKGDVASPMVSKVVVTVVDPAVAPVVPEGPGPVLRAVLGALIGFFLAISLGFLVENFGRGAQRLGRELAADSDSVRDAAHPSAESRSDGALPPSLARTARMRIDPPTAGGAAWGWSDARPVQAGSIRTPGAAGATGWPVARDGFPPARLAQPPLPPGYAPPPSSLGHRPTPSPTGIAPSVTAGAATPAQGTTVSAVGTLSQVRGAAIAPAGQVPASPTRRVESVGVPAPAVPTPAVPTPAVPTRIEPTASRGQAASSALTPNSTSAGSVAEGSSGPVESAPQSTVRARPSKPRRSSRNAPSVDSRATGPGTTDAGAPRPPTPEDGKPASRRRARSPRTDA